MSIIEMFALVFLKYSTTLYSNMFVNPWLLPLPMKMTGWEAFFTVVLLLFETSLLGSLFPQIVAIGATLKGYDLGETGFGSSGVGPLLLKMYLLHGGIAATFSSLILMPGNIDHASVSPFFGGSSISSYACFHLMSTEPQKIKKWFPIKFIAFYHWGQVFSKCGSWWKL